VAPVSGCAGRPFLGTDSMRRKTCPRLRSIYGMSHFARVSETIRPVRASSEPAEALSRAGHLIAGCLVNWVRLRRRPFDPDSSLGRLCEQHPGPGAVAVVLEVRHRQPPLLELTPQVDAAGHFGGVGKLPLVRPGPRRRRRTRPARRRSDPRCFS